MSGLVFGCLDLYLCVWTCFDVSGLVLGVSGLVFLLSVLVFGVSGLVFVVCILVGCDYGVRAQGPRPGDTGAGGRMPPAKGM